MKKRTIIIFIIFITLINTILPVVDAVQTITKANLINDHSIKTHIEHENQNGVFEVICNYICYKIDGIKYPAYCIEPGIHGVDEEGSYTVTVNDLLKDKLIYNTILSGYPYRTPAQLGVETVDDAYVATKLAVKNVLLDRDVRKLYTAMDDKGQKIIDAMSNIMQRGKAGNEANKSAIISANKNGDLIENGEYYYQEYTIYADVNISEYEIESLEKFSSGCFVTDTSGNKKYKFNSNEKFRIMIPKSHLDKEISGKINITASCNTNPIFYGEAPNGSIQDYAITYKPYAEYKTTIELNKVTNVSSIKIIKKDQETSKPIKDVSFSLYKENGEYISTKKTNAEGIAVFSDLYQGKYKLKETIANDNYVKDDTMYEISTEYNKQTSKTITNIHKKGNLKITKVDKDENDVVLEGIEFDLFDSNKNKVAHMITNQKGEARIDNINIGKYTIKETKTKDNYNLCTDNDIEVKWNETSEIKIENEKKKGQIKIIKEDKEDSEIKLEGVEFQIVDSNNRIIDNVITDKNGEAITSKIPIGEYIVKETSLGKNEHYIMNEEENIVKVNENKINEVTIKNQHKKGNLKIIKVDKDNPDVTLGAIEFDLIDESGNIIAHLITDVNGEAEIRNINTGTYTLKETKTKREYNLCENKNIVVEWNETSEVIIENEKKKGQIKIIKEDQDKREIKLVGVKFQILDKRNNIIEEIVTNENGEAISSKLVLGYYKIREIDLGNNTNYLLNDKLDTVDIKVENEKVSRVVIVNRHKKGNLKITKVDKDNNAIMLEGVKFKIIDKDGFKYEGITNEKGIAEIKDIRIGNVNIKEVETNKDYILSQTIYETEIKYNEYSEIKIENEKKKGQIELYKVDKENNNLKISNTELLILDNNNQIIEKLITNQNGYAISKKIPIGKYYLKEIKANEKYVLDDNIIPIEIKADEVLNLKIENKHKKGSLKIIKVDKDDNNITLDGIEFDLLDSDKKVIKHLITNKNGEAIVNDVNIGKYILKETKTKQDYNLCTDVGVEIKWNEISEIKIENEKKKGKIKVVKQDKENNNKKLEGVTFQILDSNNKIVDRIKTNSIGEAITSRLPLGEYLIQEIDLGDNKKYILNQEKYKVKIDAEKTTKITIENEKQKGRIQIIKSSKEDSPILNIKKGEYLSGVIFEIFNEKSELVDTIVTNGSGQALSKELEIGRYKIKEKETNRYYILNKDEYIVNIEKNNEIKILNIENDPIIPMINIEKKGQSIAEKNQEIKYEFDIENRSNDKLHNFTWVEYIPYQNSKVTKMVTGIYNENLDYEIYYRTNKKDYSLFKKANTYTSEYLDFTILKLEKGEIITEIKVEYKIVSKDFCAKEKPAIFTKINNGVKKDDKVINITKLYGTIDEYKVEDKSSFETVIQEKQIIKKLPKTGC